MTRIREYEIVIEQLNLHCVSLESNLQYQNNFILVMKNDWAEADTFLRTGNASAAQLITQKYTQGGNHLFSFQKCKTDIEKQLQLEQEKVKLLEKQIKALRKTERTKGSQVTELTSSV